MDVKVKAFYTMNKENVLSDEHLKRNSSQLFFFKLLPLLVDQRPSYYLKLKNQHRIEMLFPYCLKRFEKNRVGRLSRLGLALILDQDQLSPPDRSTSIPWPIQSDVTIENYPYDLSLYLLVN